MIVKCNQCSMLMNYQLKSTEVFISPNIGWCDLFSWKRILPQSILHMVTGVKELVNVSLSHVLDVFFFFICDLLFLCRLNLYAWNKISFLCLSAVTLANASCMADTTPLPPLKKKRNQQHLSATTHLPRFPRNETCCKMFFPLLVRLFKVSFLFLLLGGKTKFSKVARWKGSLEITHPPMTNTVHVRANGNHLASATEGGARGIVYFNIFGLFFVKITWKRALGWWPCKF